MYTNNVVYKDNEKSVYLPMPTTTTKDKSESEGTKIANSKLPVRICQLFSHTNEML